MASHHLGAPGVAVRHAAYESGQGRELPAEDAVDHPHLVDVGLVCGSWWSSGHDGCSPGNRLAFAGESAYGVRLGIDRYTARHCLFRRGQRLTSEGIAGRPAINGHLLEDQLAHPAGVGLAAHLLHHRADQRAGRGDLAVADLVGDVGVGGDGVVDGSAQRTVVGDDREPTGRDDLVGGALAGEQSVEDLARQLVVEGAVVDQGLDARDLGGRDAERRQVGLGLVGAPRQLTGHQAIRNLNQ